MTTTDDRATITCPSWCDTNAPCHGEHGESATYTPATGGEPREVDVFEGAPFPVVGVGLRLYQYGCVNNKAPHVVLNLAGGGLDSEVTLLAAEAEQVAGVSTEAVQRLRRG